MLKNIFLDKKVVELLKNFNELVMFKHTVFSLPFIFIAMLVASDGWFGFKLFLFGILATITARNFAMGVNRLLDKDIDIKNPRTKDRPNVDGRIDSNKISLFIIGNGLGFIFISYLVNSLAFKLSIPILIVLGGYSYFKRFSSLAHIVLGISLGLAPIAGTISVLEAVPIWSVLLSLGVIFWVAGFDLLYSLQDIEFDKKEGLFSIPSEYGEKATMFISKIFHTLTITFWFLFAWASNSGDFTYLAIVLSTLMLAYEHHIVNKDFSKIDKAFFTVNGYLGIIFFIFIIIDLV